MLTGVLKGTKNARLENTARSKLQD